MEKLKKQRKTTEIVEQFLSVEKQKNFCYTKLV